MKLRSKVLLIMVLVGITPVVIIGIISLLLSRNALSDQAFNQLVSVRANKQAAVERYFKNIDNQVVLFSENEMIIHAMKEFSENFKTYRQQAKITDADLPAVKENLATFYRSQFAPKYSKINNSVDAPLASMLSINDDAIALQNAYIKKNTNPLGNKHLLDFSDDATDYSKTHKRVHPIIRRYLDKFGYYDIFLVDLKSGNIVYSVFKELDYATSLLSGPYKDTNFAQSFREAASASGKDITVLKDYKQYIPSYNDPASFIASPIYDGDTKIGVAIFQMPIDRLSSIMQERSGLGETGESYLVGADKLMRCNSYLDAKRVKETGKAAKLSLTASFRGNNTVETEPVNHVLKGGKAEAKIITGYNGNSVLSAFAPVTVGQNTWVLIAEIDKAEAFREANKLLLYVIIIAVVTCIVIVMVALRFSSGLANPIALVSKTLSELAQGDFENNSAGLEKGMNRQDEIGELLQSLVKLKSYLESVSQVATKIASGNLDLSVTISGDSDVLGMALDRMVSSLNDVLGRINSSSNFVLNNANQINDTSSSLSQGATEQAASLEEISSSMTELDSQVSASAETAGQATTLAVAARDYADKGTGKMQVMSDAMEKIATSSMEIEKIIKVIDDIAFQTNLLALNAAVEAARAGKHGKGFAVVAEEVRTLAGRSAKAAKETTDLIQNAISHVKDGNSATEESTASLNQIFQEAQKVADLIGEIACTSKEQAIGVSQVREGISQIDLVTQRNAASAEETASAAVELNSQANELSSAVQVFSLKGSY